MVVLAAALATGVKAGVYRYIAVRRLRVRVNKRELAVMVRWNIRVEWELVLPGCSTYVHNFVSL